VPDVSEKGRGPEIFEASHRQRRPAADRVGDDCHAARVALCQGASVVDRVSDCDDNLAGPPRPASRTGWSRQARARLTSCGKVQARSFPSRLARYSGLVGGRHQLYRSQRVGGIGGGSDAEGQMAAGRRRYRRSWTASTMRCANRRAPIAEVSGAITTSSSPPYRATMSGPAPRAHDPRRQAAARGLRAGGRTWSFTDLK